METGRVEIPRPAGQQTGQFLLSCNLNTGTLKHQPNTDILFFK